MQTSRPILVSFEILFKCLNKQTIDDRKYMLLGVWNQYYSSFWPASSNLMYADRYSVEICYFYSYSFPAVGKLCLSNLVRKNLALKIYVTRLNRFVFP
jgi:hypothetical protein